MLGAAVIVGVISLSLLICVALRLQTVIAERDAAQSAARDWAYQYAAAQDKLDLIHTTRVMAGKAKHRAERNIVRDTANDLSRSMGKAPAFPAKVSAAAKGSAESGLDGVKIPETRTESGRDTPFPALNATRAV
jgi:hypothetical protein